jgi:hypothetical protein
VFESNEIISRFSLIGLKYGSVCIEIFVGDSSNAKAEVTMNPSMLVTIIEIKNKFTLF